MTSTFNTIVCTVEMWYHFEFELPCKMW